MHDTDKHNSQEHSYGDFYANLFDTYERTGTLNILELGVQRGGSLYAWQEYFPNAKITGVDIIDSRMEKYKTNENIHFILGDLKLVYEQLKGEKYDIIIDDSDHFDGTMGWIAENYFPLLTVGGTLVFEDVQIPTRYLKTIQEFAPPEARVEVFDMRDIKGRPDDYIITLTNV